MFIVIHFYSNTEKRKVKVLKTCTIRFCPDSSKAMIIKGHPNELTEVLIDGTVRTKAILILYMHLFGSATIQK